MAEVTSESLHQAGALHGKRELLRRQLAIRFGSVPAEVAARLDAACERDLDGWAERILDARSTRDVFGDTYPRELRLFTTWHTVRADGTTVPEHRRIVAADRLHLEGWLEGFQQEYRKALRAGFDEVEAGMHVDSTELARHAKGSFVTSHIRERFGAVPPQVLEELDATRDPDCIMWLQRMLNATCTEELIARTGS